MTRIVELSEVGIDRETWEFTIRIRTRDPRVKTYLRNYIRCGTGEATVYPSGATARGIYVERRKDVVG